MNLSCRSTRPPKSSPPTERYGRLDDHRDARRDQRVFLFVFKGCRSAPIGGPNFRSGPAHGPAWGLRRAAERPYRDHPRGSTCPRNLRVYSNLFGCHLKQAQAVLVRQTKRDSRRDQRVFLFVFKGCRSAPSPLHHAVPLRSGVRCAQGMARPLPCAPP